MALIPIPSRSVPWWVLAITALTIGGALFFEHVIGLQPCSLCLVQRNPYYAALPLAFLAGVASREANIGIIPLALMGALTLIFIVSAGLGVHHAGVEYGWWEGPAGCSGGLAFPGSVSDLQAQLEGARPVRCDEVPWSLFGLSLAGYNVLISLGLAALSALPLIRAYTQQGVEDDE
ncbi:disulfide bond formation protein B [Tepidicaulis sp.]|uniref:disulfide bond formation protein B n=1 Tax=Tepidicaulis sp. TaxID=1920809 RepID=UPI003B5CBAE9